MDFTSRSEAASRWRDVYIAAAARAIAGCGNFTAVTALVLTLQPVSGYAVSALILASTVPVVVLAPVAGRLADRVDSRRLLVAVGASQVVIALALAATGALPAIIVLMALLGCGQAIINPTLAALTPSMVRRDDLPRASATNQTAAMLGMLTGPAIGGLLVGLYGLQVPLLLNAAALLAIVGAALLVQTRRGGSRSTPAGEPGAEPRSTTPQWRLWHDPLLRTVMIVIAGVLGVIGAMNVVEVFLIRETLGAAEVSFGLLQAAWTAGMLLGTWLLARAARRARDDGALVYGLLMTLGLVCAMFSLAAMVGGPAWLAPLWIIGGLGNGGLNVYASVVVARRAPEQRRGQVYATLGATLHGAAMAGYAGGGLLVEALPIRPLVAGLGLTGLIMVGLLTGPVIRTVRRERRSPAAVAGQGVSVPG
ncbi:MFS transporter [Natronosporangium hydrolyticum]|uniref:MFS transporter n=1 Tax=Natronosporangium hydrolyticum TaxID=2811111 RepID=A0A895YKK3_9ACTN|nr:MFS transporter [Natronosporangium hydrolyticum]QSB14368.1 MFS transporter [Natronosporangium hydrolyticum]